jgi:NSS family neurotransmitter:Na+ symporter
MPEKREQWGSKTGIILALAGSAVGQGNFMGFPAKAVLNGGGVGMIPFPMLFCSWPSRAG